MRIWKMLDSDFEFCSQDRNTLCESNEIGKEEERRRKRT